ncbi:MAG: undecaprenyl-diphosphate phosphatase [Chloroflexota bacterium]
MQDTSTRVPFASFFTRSRFIIIFCVGITIALCFLLTWLGYSQSVVLGIVQGLGEFLPISSSAHLLLVPWFFGWQDNVIGTLTFDVALHLGTLIAIVAYFWRDWLDLLRAIPGLLAKLSHTLRGRHTALGVVEYRLVSLGIATIPAAIIGLSLESIIELYLRTPLLTAFMLAFVGILLFAADRWTNQEWSIDQISWRHALFIGLAQACALIPGVSRSGATITMGRFLQLSRDAATRYSFLMSTPIMLAAVAVKFDEMLQFRMADLPILFTGIGVSALVGALAIHFLLGYIKQAGFGIFAVYRILLALVIVVIVVARGDM